ncbi:MAG TPA: 2Fe-2S iron-sulfur cluster-binding protein, partial [Acidobacteriota bacterium]|nr:2Fe-2S iron-sulfur cluster-binding protein [Acidobacteriota bacterium]
MPRKFTVEVLAPRTIGTAADGDLLADVLRDAGIPMSLYCGGRGVCGKCLVEIVRGEVSPPSEREVEFLRGKRPGAGSRLACLTRVRGDLAVKVPGTSLLKDVAVLDTGLEAPLRPDPAVRKLSFDVPAPDLSDPVSAVEAIERRLGRRLRTSADAAARAAAGTGRDGGRVTATLLDGDELLDVEPGNTSSRCFGVAVDVGTSTIVVELIDLVSGRRLGRAAAVNAQTPYGADVVSRITYAGADVGNLERLADVLRKQIDGMIAGLARERAVAPGHIYEIVAAGNTAMNHILLGVPVRTLATAPYYAAFAKAPSVRAADLGLSVNPRCRVHVAPNLRSFVGGDIAAGTSALDLA